MTENRRILQQMYERFNARDIDGVLSSLSDKVVWANGMDGGHIHGLEAVRDYWTRQWAIVRPQVTPVDWSEAPNGGVVVDVQQSVRDLQGRPLQEQTHDLRDKLVRHAFTFSEGKVTHFDIQDGDSAAVSLATR